MARKPQPSTITESADTTEVTRFQAFAVKRIHRSRIANAPYNPRTIDSDARERLQRNLKSVGLVAPSTWNERTGNLVGGHQRQAALDALEGTEDYWLDVAAVDLDPVVEREQNVFLNNRHAQGDWDMALLAEMMTADDIDVTAAGFSPIELQVLLEDEGVTMFDDESGIAAIEDLKRVGAEKSAKRHADREPDKKPSKAVRGETDVATRSVTEDTDTHALVVFLTREERAIFCAALGYDAEVRYVDGAKVFKRLGIDPEAAWTDEFKDVQRKAH